MNCNSERVGHVGRRLGLSQLEDNGIVASLIVSRFVQLGSKFDRSMVN